MGNIVVFWGTGAGVGRRTVARRLAQAWLDQSVSALVIEVDPNAAAISPDPATWLARYKDLAPAMLRRFLAPDPEQASTQRLSALPRAELITSWTRALRAAFDRIVIISPGTSTAEETALLEWSSLILSICGVERHADTVVAKHLEMLATMHLPYALLRVVLNRLPQDVVRRQRYAKEIAGRPVIAALAEDEGFGLQWHEGITRLAEAIDASLEPCANAKNRSPLPEVPDVVRDFKQRVQPELLKTLPPLVPKGKTVDAAAAQRTVEACLAEDTTLPASREVRTQIVERVLDEVLGLGPLEPLLKDPSVSEVMVNGVGTLYVERRGQLEPVESVVQSESQLRAIIDRIVTPLGRRVDESMPLCDARLSDGSRVNIVLPPLALDGPVLTIRKFSIGALSIQDLVRLESLSPSMADFLDAAVKARRNIVVSGGTGSGKTTLLNALSCLIPDGERIVTIEDAAELRLQKPHVVRLESRPANAEGLGEIPIRRLVMNALRMRPDRIVIGECRGGEALDMLQAMNTGHDGSLTTLHANSPRDALGRLETLTLMAGLELPVRVVREQIRSAIHVIVQQARLANGRRRIVSVTEVTGMEGDTLTTQELFAWRHDRFIATGLRSRSLETVS